MFLYWVFNRERHRGRPITYKPVSEFVPYPRAQIRWNSYLLGPWTYDTGLRRTNTRPLPLQYGWTHEAHFVRGWTSSPSFFPANANAQGTRMNLMTEVTPSSLHTRDGRKVSSRRRTVSTLSGFLKMFGSKTTGSRLGVFLGPPSRSRPLWYWTSCGTTLRLWTGTHTCLWVRTPIQLLLQLQRLKNKKYKRSSIVLFINCFSLHCWL